MGKTIPYEGNRPYVFVSYSHADADIVNETIDILHDKYNYRIWFDNGIHSGENWSKKIVKQIQNCSTFVVFLSPNAVKSRNVGSEISIAFNNNSAKLIPIWITEKCPLDDGTEYYLSGTQRALESVPGVHSAELMATELDSSIPDSLRDAYNVENGVLVNTEDNIHDLILDPSITEIADSACKERLNLKLVQFSDKLEFIGNEVFRGCSSISELFIPRNVKHIGDSCFRDCVGLRKLRIQEEIEIGERAFENCRELSEIILPNDLAEIYSGVFNSCHSLTEITLPSSLFAIGDNAFASCTHLKRVILPNGVSRIDDAVFSGCIRLQSVVIPESVTKIGKNVFKDCTSLTKVNIPAGLRKIDSGCFRGCTNLSSITVNPKNKKYKSMDGIMFSKNKSVLVCYPANIEQEEYEIPDSVSIIEDWSFANCTKLKRIIIPDSVETIGEGAFINCTNLEEIVIPYSVDSINDTAFRGCKNLKKVYIESKTLKDFGWGVFYRCSRDLTVYYCSDIVKEYCERINVNHERFTPKDD